ncbi:MAG: 50S ribosomal protein L18 [Patescibacteria group bacterium]
MPIKSQEQKRKHKHARIRVKIKGTANCPRLSVFRSLKSMICQLINDDNGTTLVYLTDRQLKTTNKKKETPVEQANALGKKLAEIAKELGINKVVFDRGGFRYHGRIRAVAEAARANGLKF